MKVFTSSVNTFLNREWTRTSYLSIHFESFFLIY